MLQIQKWFDLREKLSDSLSKDEFLKMKTLCKKEIAERNLEDINNPYYLIRALEDYKDLNPWNSVLLQTIMTTIGRKDIADEIHRKFDQNNVICMVGTQAEIYFERENTLYELRRAAKYPHSLKKLYRGRIMLVGAFGAGKTSTKRSLLKEVFEHAHVSTDGADVYEIDITEWIIKESITDGYQGERSVEITKMMMEDALISGIKKQQSDHAFGEQERKSTPTDDTARASSDGYATGRTTSIADNLEYDDDLHRRIKKRLKDVQDVDKPNLYFSLWDSAGQVLYYNAHQVFMASKVIYILTTDLTKALEDILSRKGQSPDTDDWKVKDYISFWMNSIHAYARSDLPCCKSEAGNPPPPAPPVIIVGTKKDLLDKNNGNVECKKRLDDIMDYIRKHCVAASEHVVGMFAIDNKSRQGDTPTDPTIEELRQRIRQLATEYFLLGEVPAKWIHLELSLRQMRKQTLSLKEVYEIGKKTGMEKVEMDKALEFYHGVGEILHFANVPELRDTVILDVGWLVNLFKLVITQHAPCKDDMAPKLHNQLDEYTEKGRLHQELLVYMLNKHGRKDDMKIVVKILEMFDILCKMPWPSSGRQETKVYYLPCLLQRHEPIHPQDSEVRSPLYFHFPGNFLPDGIYYRLIVRCARQWSRHPILFKHTARIAVQLGGVPAAEVTIRKIGSDIELDVLQPQSLDGSSPRMLPKTVCRVRETVETQLSELVKAYTPGITYSVSLKCPCDRHKPGKLCIGGTDIDDRCVAIDTGVRDSRKKSGLTCYVSHAVFGVQALEKWFPTNSARTRKVSRAEQTVPTLVEFLFSLDSDLSRDDESQLRFLLSREIPRHKMEELQGPKEIFEYLEEIGRIGENNLGFLRYLLKAINRIDLTKVVDDYTKQRQTRYTP